MQQLYPLRGAVQHYSWGGNRFIPALMGQPNNEDKPFAELWLGAHPGAPAQVQAGTEWKPLPQLLQEQPRLLGEDVQQRFGALPYLLKVLDVRHMLSIQVHPTKAVAAQRFQDEERAGVPRNAPHRNYKDENHKPELMVALSDFWLLHGFKPAAQLRQTWQEVPELNALESQFAGDDYKQLYRYVMQLPQQEVNQLLQPLVGRIVPQYEQGLLQKSSPHFWAARAVQHFCAGSNLDRGIFSIYFFNLLHLKRGEGIYQPAGLPHAYLEGQNVEIMAASDNVLRAGLTDKWMDVPELLAQTHFAPTHPHVISAGAGNTVYASPAAEFELSKIALVTDVPQNINTASPETFLVTEGVVQVSSGGEVHEVKKGAALFAGSGVPLTLKAQEPAVLYRATVPVLA